MTGVTVRIGAETDQLDAAVKRSKSQLSQLRGEMREGINTAAKWGTAVVAAGGVIAANLTRKGLQAVDAQAKLAQSLNTTANSMAVLERAGGLTGISVEKINASATRLTRRLSLAEAGTGPAAEAIKRLGINAAEVAELPLDERIAFINQRINEMAPAAQRAGLATQFFGEEAGIAMRRLNPEAMAQAAREAEVLGTNLSAVEAAQVEAANDALSTMGTALEGVSKRMAIELSPILEAIGKQFFEAAEEAGGVGEAVSDAFGFVVDASAHVINAVEGINRIFSVVADGIIAAWNKMVSIILSGVEKVIETIDAIPGVDMSESLENVRNFGNQAAEVARMAVDNIHNTLMEPLPGNQFKEFVAQAREASKQAAEEGINLSNQLMGNQAQGESQGEMKDPEAEKQKQQIKERLERIREANLTEREIAQEKLEKDLEFIRMAREQKLATEKELNEREKQVFDEHETKLTAIKERERKRREQQDEAMRDSFSDALGDMSTLMNTENRKMFEIGKAAAIANSLLNAYEAITGAYKVGANIGGPPLGAAFAAAAGAAQFAQVQAIKSQSFGGGGGGGGGAGSATANVNAQSQRVQPPNQSQEPNRNVSINLQGDTFGREQVRGLIGQINEELDDGARLRVN